MLIGLYVWCMERRIMEGSKKARVQCLIPGWFGWLTPHSICKHLNETSEKLASVLLTKFCNFGDQPEMLYFSKRQKQSKIFCEGQICCLAWLLSCLKDFKHSFFSYLISPYGSKQYDFCMTSVGKSDLCWINPTEVCLKNSLKKWPGLESAWDVFSFVD